MGKIIETEPIIYLKRIIGPSKRGHIIGIKNNFLLCELLDENNNFIKQDGKREIFAVSPNYVQQIGYLVPSKK